MDILSKGLVRLPKLGWPAAMLALWAGLGWLGHSLLGSAWRQAQVSEFERSVQAVAQLARSQNWNSPWESDPNWQELERQLAVDLVPLSEAATIQTTWVRAPDGGWRASVTVPLEGVAQVKAVRGTRTYNDHGIDGPWWIAWSGFCGFVVSLTWLVMQRGRRELQREREELALWRRATPKDDELPAAQSQVRQLQSIMSNLHEGVLVVDHPGRILLVNQVLIEQLGLNPRDEYVGRPLLEAIRVRSLIELIEQAQRSGQVKEQMIEVGNAPRYLQLYATVQAIDGGLPGVLLTATDVSSSQRSELARREFVTGASHELKTPLAAIRAYTETLQDMHVDDPEMAVKFLQNILDQADRMDRLVSGMLQLARAESGALKMKVQRLDASMTLKPCIEAAEGMARTKNIEFIARLPGDRTLVMADRDALQTIASNLLSNALRYTPSGGRVEIEFGLCSLSQIASQRASRVTSSGRSGLASQPAPAGTAGPAAGADQGADQASQVFSLVVKDSGIGIPEAEQGRIFERFYRVQKDRSLDSGGTGLGLAIVKQLVHSLDGRIELVSVSGQGTRFEILLPAVGFTQSSSNTGG